MIRTTALLVLSLICTAVAPAEVDEVRPMKPVRAEEEQDGEVDDAERGLHELSS